MSGKRENNKKSNKSKQKKNKTENNKSKDKKGSFKNKHPRLMLVIKIMIIAVILLALIGAGIVAGIFLGLFGNEFKITKEELTVATTNSVVKDLDGNIIAVLSGDEKREVVSLSDMPKYLPDAFVSIEDERFEKHHGVDIKRTLAATLTYITHNGKSSFGGSTITQQLVKNITKEDEKDWTRKVKEMARAYQVEKLISKDQILELYLNLIYLGEGNIHGVELASRYYFNKSVSELDLAQCAFLAGINHAPNAYNPFKEDKSDMIKTRTKTVLNKMLELGKIQQSEYDEAVKEVEDGLVFEQGKINQNSSYSYHTEATINQVKKQLIEEKGWKDEYADLYVKSKGLVIYSTQNSEIQSTMEEEFAKDKYIVKSKKKQGEHSQAAMVIIDQSNGYVVGTVGGLGEKTSSFGLNRATQSVRPTGSSMKPLAVIAPALEAGIITAGSVYDDVPTTFTGKWKPENYYKGYKGLSTVRYAIEISQNIVPAKILADLGTQNSIKFLKSIGITSLDSSGKDDALAPLALGGLTHGISPLQMAAGYATIANDGVYIEPTFFTKVEDINGNVVLEAKQSKKEVMSKSNAYIAKSILTQPVVGANGTATYCAISGMDVCAKTGTTNDDFDRWLCGFTPYYTGAAWYGYDENEPVVYSGNPAGKLWDSIMTETHKNLEKKRFTKPSDIIEVAICKDSGLLPTEACQNDQRGSRVYTEIFVKGTEPTKKCDCHVRAKVIEQDGQLAIYEGDNPNAKELVFITRKDSEKNTSWKSANDAKYMLPTLRATNVEETEEPKEDLIKEQEPPKETEKPTNNTVNNSVANNTTNPGNNVENNVGNNTNSSGSNTNSSGNNTNVVNVTDDSTTEE